MDSAYVRHAVSNPKLTGMNSFFRSASMVLGAPHTLVLHPCALKYSASMAALVLLSSAQQRETGDTGEAGGTGGQAHALRFPLMLELFSGLNTHRRQ